MERVKNQTWVLILDYVYHSLGFYMPAPSAVSVQLQSICAGLEAQHEGDLTRMAQAIQYKDESMESLMGSVQSIVRLAFQGRGPTWGLVITLVAFTGAIAAERRTARGSLGNAESLLEAVTEMLQEHGGAWLLETGGWENMPPMLPGVLRRSASDGTP